MATFENTCEPFINRIDGDTSSMKQIESLDVVVLSSTRTMTISSNISNDDRIPRIKYAKAKSVDNNALSGLSRRLSMRKNLHNRLSLVSDIMCFLGVLGIILMIIANEITFCQIDHNDNIFSWFIKLVISFSTIILIGFIVKYHLLRAYLYCVNNSIEDWRITITNRNIFLILFEILICTVHPIPRCFPHSLNASLENTNLNSSSIITNHSLSYIATDVALGLPMFARLYLVCRFTMFHSHLMHDALSQSVGYLNKISINFFFLMKTYLESAPISCLSIFCLILFLVGSWSLRACNYLPNNEHLSMLDAMWLFIVTFTTVGYGDFTPSTYCGRGIAALIGLVGVFSTAIIIAILARKLLLDRWEKHVHNFVLKIELAKQRKILAANVVKGTIRVWYLRNKTRSGSTFRYLQAQRQLLQSVHMLQQTKQEQRKLVDGCVDQSDLHSLQRNSIDKTHEVSQQLKIMRVKMDRIERELAEINTHMNNKIGDIQKTLNVLLDKLTE